MTKGLMISAPASGTRGTTVLPGLLRALCDTGRAAQPVRRGPDQIAAVVYLATCGRASLQLDARTMGLGPDSVLAEAARDRHEMGTTQDAAEDGYRISPRTAARINRGRRA